MKVQPELQVNKSKEEETKQRAEEQAKTNDTKIKPHRPLKQLELEMKPKLETDEKNLLHAIDTSIIIYDDHDPSRKGPPFALPHPPPDPPDKENTYGKTNPEPDPPRNEETASTVYDDDDPNPGVVVTTISIPIRVNDLNRTSVQTDPPPRRRDNCNCA